MEKLKLNSELVIDKEFDVSTMGGYNAKQVDLFLDVVASDYEIFEEMIKKYESKIKDLEKSNDKLKHDLDATLKEQVVSNEVVNTEKINTLDILKRLSKLEQEVYNNQ